MKVKISVGLKFMRGEVILLLWQNVILLNLVCAFVDAGKKISAASAKSHKAQRSWWSLSLS